MAKKKMLPLKVGCLVAVNDLKDTVWFELLEIDGNHILIREYHETIKYKPQNFDKSLIKQVKYLD